MAYENNNPSRNVNTDGISFYGDTSMMRCDYWETLVMFKMFPVKADVGDSTHGRYDYKNRVQVTLPGQSAVFLGKWIEDEFIPAIKENRAKEIGITSGKVNMVYLSTNINENGKAQPIIALYTNIGADHRPTEAMIYSFSNKRIFNSYSADTGDYSTEDSIIFDVYVLSQFLKNCINLFGSTAHSINTRRAETDNANTIFQQSVAGKLGVPIMTNQYNYVRRNTKADPFDNNSNNTAAHTGSVSTPAPTTVTSLEDLNDLV